METGKRADVIVVNLNSLHSTPCARDLVSALVYSAQTTDVESVVIDGRLVLNDRKLLTLDEKRSVLDGRESVSGIDKVDAGIDAEIEE